jgi:hypothetical protein
VVNRTHGLKELKTAVNRLANRGGKVIDERTAVGKSLMRWRAQLVQDLGGQEALSTQQLAIVDIAVRTRLLLDSTDAWMVRQPSLINRHARQLYPVVQQRTALADSLVRQLTTLGLGRQAKKVFGLERVMAARPEAEKTP